jgi:hydrogenase maturation protein HypF
MTIPLQISGHQAVAVEIRVRGRVQGVGFRPAVWRIARDLHLGGEVLNDAEGVMIRLVGASGDLKSFIERLYSDAPPLARIESIVSKPFRGHLPGMFRIAESVNGAVHTEVAPDAAICDACAAEIVNPFEGRYRYPFTNCTHCGPRLSIIQSVPYDRAHTTMAAFDLCEACLQEYRDPANRRFHAEAIACHSCGPRTSLIRLDGGVVSYDQHSMLDDVDAAGSLIQKGEIVAIKGLGGYQLACDAANAAAVARLRALKGRETKPFALMARDIDVVRRYCRVSEIEAAALRGAEAPIVLLRAGCRETLPEEVAPRLKTLGFMLPTTPLHLLMLRRMDRPVVMTSGNISDEPQVTCDAEAMEKLGAIASYALIHDRDIANRVDDSVAREIGGRIRVIRRARGYAPSPVMLPAGFRAAPEILAMGGELKATACLIKDGVAILTQHQGDLENAATYADYRNSIKLYSALFHHEPHALVADQHPDYLSTKLAAERARKDGLTLIQVQHHHAHVASCLAENGRALGAAPVLGIVLDGLGLGDDGSIWGGEFLLADYEDYQRLGCLKPVAMLGGAQAAREPWRNLYAHLMAQMGWADFAMNFSGLPLFACLEGKPRATLDAMLKRNINSPLASSCGRLFDAVAAALGVCRERQCYEGQAGAELEAMADETTLRHPGTELYPVAIPNLAAGGLPYIEPVGMWRAVLGDLVLQTPAPVIAARFHLWLADSIAAMTVKLARRDAAEGPRFNTVALSGGCFQNRILFEEVVKRLEAEQFSVLTHSRLPANDGGLALGQAAIGAARLIRSSVQGQEAACVSEFPAAS